MNTILALEKLASIFDYYKEHIADLTATVFAIKVGEEELVKYRSDVDAKSRTILQIGLRMILVYGIVLFEEMIKEYMKVFFQVYPRTLIIQDNNGNSKSKCLDYDTILGAGSYEELLDVMIEKEIYKFGRKNIDEIERFFDRKLKVEPFSTRVDKWEELRRGYYVRNLIVHNRGVMNEFVYKKIEWGQIGESVQIQPKLVFDLNSALGAFNEYLYKVFKDKLRAA